MRGRDLFYKHEIIISFLIKSLKLFPLSFVRFGLELFRNTPGLLGFGIRYILIARLIKKCGKAVSIYPGVYFLNPDQLEISDYVSIHQMCYLESFGGISIGPNVGIAHGVSIISVEHNFHQQDLPMRDARILANPVIIEADVWIGAGAKILAGVTIGKGAVVGAGAVVTKSVPERSIAVGIPARVVTKR